MTNVKCPKIHPYSGRGKTIADTSKHTTAILLEIPRSIYRKGKKEAFEFIFHSFECLLVKTTLLVEHILSLLYWLKIFTRCF